MYQQRALQTKLLPPAPLGKINDTTAENRNLHAEPMVYIRCKKTIIFKKVKVPLAQYGLETYRFSTSKPTPTMHNGNLLYLLGRYGIQARLDTRNAISEKTDWQFIDLFNHPSNN